MWQAQVLARREPEQTQRMLVLRVPERWVLARQVLVWRALVQWALVQWALVRWALVQRAQELEQWIQVQAPEPKWAMEVEVGRAQVQERTKGLMRFVAQVEEMAAIRRSFSRANPHAGQVPGAR